MKKNENKKTNRNRSSVALLVLCALLAVTLVGCKKPVAEKPSPSTSEVVSEVVSEEVSEPVSEELSEEVVSEKVSEEVSNEVEYVNFSNYNELLDYVKRYDKTTIVQYNFAEKGTPQAIIPNGGYYTIKEGTLITVIPNKEVTDVNANVSHISVEKGMDEWIIFIQTTGTDLEVSFTVNYADGTSEDFTIYVTVE